MDLSIQHQKGKLKEILEIERVIEGNFTEAVCSSLLAMANRKNTCSVLERIDIPTLIMVGQKDEVIPLAKSDFMHTRINGSTLHVISDAAHLSNIDNPVEFNRHLSEFLQQVKRKAKIACCKQSSRIWKRKNSYYSR